MSDATEAEIARAEKRGVEKARKVVADKLAREEARLREHENPITSPMLRNYLGGLWVAIEALDRAGLLVDGGRSEAEIKAEALREAAEAMRLAKEPGHRYLRDPLGVYDAVSQDAWLERRATLLARRATRLAKEGDQ